MAKQGYDPSRCHLQKAGPSEPQDTGLCSCFKGGIQAPTTDKYLLI